MADYYIAPAPTGNNANAGTEASPWETLAYAYANSTTNDTIHFSAGTHSWVTINMINRTLVGAGRDVTTISAGSMSAAQFWYMDKITVSDMTFTNNGPSGNYQSLFTTTTAQGVFCEASFTRCIFHNLASDGQSNDYNFGIFGPWTRATNSTQGVTLNNCLLYDIKRYVGGAYGLIYSVSIPSSAAPTTIGYFNCNNCVFYLDNSGALMINYIIYDWYATQTLSTFKNCIAYNASGGTTSWTSGVGLTNTNCCGYLMTAGGMTGTGNITTDPLFIDAENRDYRLRPNSPAMDTGVDA